MFNCWYKGAPVIMGSEKYSMNKRFSSMKHIPRVIDAKGRLVGHSGRLIENNWSSGG
jgi:hypothetical protein